VTDPDQIVVRTRNAADNGFEAVDFHLAVVC
jgi:hypothetical protein